MNILPKNTNMDMLRFAKECLTDGVDCFELDKVYKTLLEKYGPKEQKQKPAEPDSEPDGDPKFVEVFFKRVEAENLQYGKFLKEIQAKMNALDKILDIGSSVRNITEANAAIAEFVSIADWINANFHPVRIGSYYEELAKPKPTSEKITLIRKFLGKFVTEWV